MNNNVQKNWKSLIICFLTFALLAASAYYYINSQSNEVPKYSEIVSQFKNNEVQSFEIDLTTGSMEYKTFKEPDKVQKYTVISVTYFLEDKIGRAHV